MAILSPMIFKSFVWPHNPEIYEIQFDKDVIQHRYPGINNAEIEDMGMKARVFIGSGVFFGPGAYEKAQELANYYYDRTPGPLIHPTWMQTNAVFSKYKIKNQPLPDYVEYEFEFIEHVEMQVIVDMGGEKTANSNNGNKPGASTNKTASNAKGSEYIVKKGDTLSGIGKKYGVPWKDIANANKNIIKDPNKIQVGMKLVIPGAKKNPVQEAIQKKNTPNPTASKPKPPVIIDTFKQIQDPALKYKVKK